MQQLAKLAFPNIAAEPTVGLNLTVASNGKKGGPSLWKKDYEFPTLNKFTGLQTMVDTGQTMDPSIHTNNNIYM